MTKNESTTTPEDGEQEGAFLEEATQNDHPETYDTASDTGAEEALAEEGEAETGETAPPADDQLLRLRADFDNFRKRIQREKAEWNRDATARVMETLLPVLDHFRMGMDNAKKHEAKTEVLEGFEMVWNQLETALGQLDLKTVESVGTPFDPSCHEALQAMPSDEVEADVVLEEFRRGYRLGDRLLRPAQVIVSSGPSSTEEG